MAWDKGFNFRLTSTFVTDGANETYVIESDTYPTTRNGVTFGWEQSPSEGSRDRDAGIDRRLAGLHTTLNDGASQCNFRVDLEAAANYTIRLAVGDPANDQTYQYFQFKDTTSILRTVADTNGTLAANYDDATGVNRTEAAWPGSNAADAKTFATSIFRLLIGSPTSQSGPTTVNHLFLSRTGGTFSSTPGGSSTPTGALSRQAKKVFSGASTPVGGLRKQLNKVFGGASTPVGTLLILRAIFQSFSGSSTPVGTLTKLVNKFFSGLSTPIGTLIRQFTQSSQIEIYVTLSVRLVTNVNITVAPATGVYLYVELG